MTMRPRLLLLAAGLLLPASAQAQSNSATSTFAVNASVPGACAVGAPALAAGRQINFRGLNGTTLQIDQMVDPTTLSTNAASVEVRFDAVCTFPHRLKVETQNNGLWSTSERPGRAPEGFANAVPYRADVTWADRTLRLTADAGVRRTADSSVFVPGAGIGDILLRLEIDPGATNERANAPLLAGVYGDTIRITLEPQQ
jgi:hypothetical protein